MARIVVIEVDSHCIRLTGASGEVTDVDSGHGSYVRITPFDSVQDAEKSLEASYEKADWFDFCPVGEYREEFLKALGGKCKAMSYWRIIGSNSYYNFRAIVAEIT